MTKLLAALALVLLAACQSSHKLEENARYSKLALVVDKHEFSDIERKQAQANTPSDSRVGVGVGVGVGSGGFGGMMIGMGSTMGVHPYRSDEPAQIAHGAIRYTVRPLGTEERIEVLSYGQYKLGDCVKVLAGHPTEFPRFFELKPDERCN